MSLTSLRLVSALFIVSSLATACSTPGFDSRDASDARSDATATSDGGDASRGDAMDRTDIATMDVSDAADDRADGSIATDGSDTIDAHSGCRVDTECAAGRVCCPATGACYDPSCTTCCLAPTDAGIDPDAGTRCARNTDCAAGEYCNGDSCGGTAGTCAPIPDHCDTIVDPVCGCDGIDYVNPCGAAAASTRVAYRGMCPGPDAGPGDCVDNSACAAGEFCSGIGCATPGMCIARPTVCDDTIDPVCACDGTTYQNGCRANAAGVRVIARGTCAGDDAGFGDGGVITPSCVDNSRCGRGQFCDGAGCATDGTCVMRPDLCPDIVDPVCGCNGLTYTNECEAHSAGTRVASRGECPDRCVGVTCAAGRVCCPSTGACYDPACLACCTGG
jgi:hypothetical protein